MAPIESITDYGQWGRKTEDFDTDSIVKNKND